MSRLRCAALLALFSTLPALAHEPEESPPQAGLTAPQLVERFDPLYPEAARRAGIGGVVGLELDVLPDGSVGEIKVQHPAGFGLDEAAVAAAKRFRFKPATRDGRPIAATVLFDQRFVIRPHLTAETSAEPEPQAPPAPPLTTTSVAPPSYQSTVTSRGAPLAASATTVRSADFELRPRTAPNDLLREVPGLLTAQHQGGGKADQLFLRGFDADHGSDVALFVDGVPINLPSHAHGQGYADLNWIIPEAIERIDVEKGPYDARWGDFATAGAINLVTRDKLASSSVQYTFGSLPTISGRAAAQGRFVGIAAPSLPGWASKLHPWIAVEAAYDDGPFTRSADLQRYSLFAKVSYDVTPAFAVGVFFQAYGSGWVGSGQIPTRDVARIGRFGSEDPSEGGATEREMLTAFTRYRGGSQELDGTVYFTRYRLSLFNDFTFFLRDPANGDEIEQDDARTVVGGKISYHFHRRWRSISLRTTVGVEMRWDGAHVDRFYAESQHGDFRQRLGRVSDGSSLGFSGADDDLDLLNIAAYAEEDVLFTRWLRLVAALRADYFGYDVSDRGQTLGAGLPNTSGTRQLSVFSPKASAIFSPIHDVLDFYLDFGQGFHSNQAQAALADGRTLTQPDGSKFVLHALPRLFGGEIGARAHLWDRLDASAAFWLSYLENETVFDADAAAFVPAAPTRRIGFDLSLRARLLRWLAADFDLAQAAATAVPDGGNGGAVALAPRLYMTGGLSVDHKSGVRAGLRFRYLGDRPAFDESSPEYRYFTSRSWMGRANPDYDPARVTAQGYFVVDAYLAYRWRFLEAALAVQNLLNATWREAQLGNRSCTFDETFDVNNRYYSGSGNRLSDGSFANRCGVTLGATRSGVADVHFTPGVPFNPQLTVKAYF